MCVCTGLVQGNRQPSMIGPHVKSIRDVLPVRNTITEHLPVLTNGEIWIRDHSQPQYQTGTDFICVARDKIIPIQVDTKANPC